MDALNYNFVYETPCGGAVTGLMRLGEEGFVEILPAANLGGGKLVDKGDGRVEPGRPDMPLGRWLPMLTLGSYAREDEMVQAVNQRDGWAVAPHAVLEGES